MSLKTKHDHIHTQQLILPNVQHPEHLSMSGLPGPQLFQRPLGARMGVHILLECPRAESGVTQPLSLTPALLVWPVWEEKNNVGLAVTAILAENFSTVLHESTSGQFGGTHPSVLP